MDKTPSTSPKKIFPTSSGANVKMASPRKITSPKKTFPISIEAASEMGSSKTLFPISTGTISQAASPSKSTSPKKTFPISIGAASEMGSSKTLFPISTGTISPAASPSKSTSPKKVLPTSSGITYKERTSIIVAFQVASSEKILPTSTVVAPQMATAVASQMDSPKKILPTSSLVEFEMASTSKSSCTETNLPSTSAAAYQKSSPKRILPTSSGAIPKGTCPYKRTCPTRILQSSSRGASQEEGSDIVVVKSPKRPPLYVPADSVQAVHAASSPEQHKCDICGGSRRRSPRNVVVSADTKICSQCGKVQEMANSPRRSPRNILASSIEAISLQVSPKRGECFFHCMCFHEGADHDDPGTSDLVLFMSPTKRHKKLLHANLDLQRELREVQAEKLRLQLEEEEKLQPPKSPSPRASRRSSRTPPNVRIHEEKDKFNF